MATSSNAGRHRTSRNTTAPSSAAASTNRWLSQSRCRQARWSSSMATCCTNRWRTAPVVTAGCWSTTTW